MAFFGENLSEIGIFGGRALGKWHFLGGDSCQKRAFLGEKRSENGILGGKNSENGIFWGKSL